MGTLRLQCISDVHLEFYQDGGKAVIESFNPANVDVLLLVGDILSLRHLDAANSTFERFRQRYPGIPILYTPGNHDFWATKPSETLNLLQHLKHVNVLYNNTFTHRGQRFVGTTMWFPKWNPLSEYAATQMPDFSRIDGFRNWVVGENRKAVKYLRSTVEPGDVVMTHYLPSLKCVSPRFFNSPLNDFFVGPVDSLIIEKKPKLWVHGHTHDSVDIVIGDTRVFCNPYGYPHERNLSFTQETINA